LTACTIAEMLAPSTTAETTPLCLTQNSHIK
jgi:hypothetical protein